jgi:hypothetical protein
MIWQAGFVGDGLLKHALIASCGVGDVIAFFTLIL